MCITAQQGRGFFGPRLREIFWPGMCAEKIQLVPNGGAVEGGQVSPLELNGQPPRASHSTARRARGVSSSWRDEDQRP